MPMEGRTAISAAHTEVLSPCPPPMALQAGLHPVVRHAFDVGARNVCLCEMSVLLRLQASEWGTHTEGLLGMGTSRGAPQDMVVAAAAALQNGWPSLRDPHGWTTPVSSHGSRTVSSKAGSTHCTVIAETGGMIETVTMPIGGSTVPLGRAGRCL